MRWTCTASTQVYLEQDTSESGTQEEGGARGRDAQVPPCDRGVVGAARALPAQTQRAVPRATAEGVSPGDRGAQPCRMCTPEPRGKMLPVSGPEEESLGTRAGGTQNTQLPTLTRGVFLKPPCPPNLSAKAISEDSDTVGIHTPVLTPPNPEAPASVTRGPQKLCDKSPLNAFFIRKTLNQIISSSLKILPQLPIRIG